MFDNARVRAKRAALLSCAFTVCCTLLFTRGLAAQEHEHDDDHDHDHGALHFSHPLITESPSPDTKIRVDYLWRRLEDNVARERALRVEAEYAFLPGFSLEVSAPMLWRSASGANASGFGSTEVAAKFASFALAHRGVLLGGGAEVALPTGSDMNGIGSSHVVELEPFIDAAFKRSRYEAVLFTRYGTTTRLRPGEQAERDLAFSGSGLGRMNSRVELLLEATAGRSLTTGDPGTWATTIAPGIKATPFLDRAIMFGAALNVPVSRAREADRELLVSAMYHF
jgi:hypothetical protein